ncbi:MAG: type II toxin-antitoxin system mRNA interferase toxin, RelE/StbE family [Candidatus Rokubacteria bacterium]|nr:type II toxin-antitoxin system mRNA interferase toxin, RelE/StbE family [Candidatus Rokubacteria bacterium]
MAFSIEYREDARRDLSRYSRRLRKQITTAVNALVDDPEPAASAALWGDWAGHRRLHIAGMQRVIYRINYREYHIEIVAIGPRGQVYG